jgi:hypothetical protein
VPDETDTAVQISVVINKLNNKNKKPGNYLN